MVVPATATSRGASETARGSPGLSWWDLTLQLLQIVAAGAALFGWVTLVGGARVYARFQAAEFPSPIRTVTLVPRDALFAEGLRALWKPLLLGLVVASLLYLVFRRREANEQRLWQVLDARFGARYDAYWSNPGRSRLDAKSDFGRYVQLRRERTFGDLPATPAEQLDTLDGKGGGRSWAPDLGPLRGAVQDIGWWLFAGVAVLVLVAALGLSVLADIDFLPALVLLGAIAAAIALATLAFQTVRGAARRAFVIFAAIVVVWSLVLLIVEWGQSHPKLDWAYVALKGKSARVVGVFVAQLDGNLYLADTSQEKQRGKSVKRTWLFMTPGDQIEQVAIVGSRGHNPPPLPPDKAKPPVKGQPPILVFPLSPAGPAGPPTPDPPADTTGPDFLPLGSIAARLDRSGTFAVRLVRFDERVSGQARFITQPVSLPGGRRRLALGTRSFQAEARRAPVLRITVSRHKEQILRRRLRSVRVTVRIVAADSLGNARRTSACVRLILKPGGGRRRVC